MDIHKDQGYVIATTRWISKCTDHIRIMTLRVQANEHDGRPAGIQGLLDSLSKEQNPSRIELV